MPDLPVLGSGVELGKTPHAAQAGVVHQQVRRRRRHGVCHAVEIRLGCQIRRHHLDLYALFGAQELCQGFHARRIAGHQAQIVLVLGQPLGERLANAGGSSGHEGPAARPVCSVLLGHAHPSQRKSRIPAGTGTGEAILPQGTARSVPEPEMARPM
jgi:hypothetical protein